MSKIIGKVKKMDFAIYRTVKNYDGKSTNENISFIAQNRFALSVKLPFVCRTLSHFEYTHYDEHLYEYLAQHNFRITEDGLTAFLKSRVSDDAFLSTLHARIIFCCIKGIYSICVSDTRLDAPSVFAFLSDCDRFDYANLYAQASPTEQLLLKNKTYVIGDTATRACFRAKLEKYAKRHKIKLEKLIESTKADELDRIFFSEGGKGKKPLYFISIAAITVLLFLLCCSAFGIDSMPYGLIVAVLLIPSFYECGKYLTDYCFSRRLLL